MMTHLKKSILFFLAVFVVFPLAAHGQMFAENPDELPALLEATPENPGPRQKVDLKVTSFLADLNSAPITWYVNDKRISSGTGLRNFSTTVGDIGSVTTVTVVVEAEQGTITKSLSFRPAHVTLISESGSYRPPFYKGKTEIGPQSKVRVIALPQFGSSLSNSKDYIFTWTKDGRVLGSQSGYGKSVLEFISPIAGATSNIGVTVSSSDELRKATSKVIIQSTQPKVVVYPFSPAYGVFYNQAVNSTVYLSSKETSFFAVPYFLSSDGQLVNYTWTMNGKELADNKSALMTFRNESNAKGETTVGVTAGSSGLNRTGQKSFSVSF